MATDHGLGVGLPIGTVEERDAAIAEVRRCLDKLAHECETSDAVADRLRETHTVGVCGNVRRCAIAQYVLDQTGYLVEVEESLIALSGLPYLVTGIEAEAWIPHPVTEFIRDFDNERYPDLMT